MVAKIQQRKEVVNKQCAELVESLKVRGYRTCVLKGQGVSAESHIHAFVWLVHWATTIDGLLFCFGEHEYS